MTRKPAPKKNNKQQPEAVPEEIIPDIILDFVDAILYGDVDEDDEWDECDEAECSCCSCQDECADALDDEEEEEIEVVVEEWEEGDVKVVEGEAEEWDEDDDDDDDDDDVEWDDEEDDDGDDEEEEVDPEEFSTVLNIVCIAWNLAALPKQDRAKADEAILANIREQCGEDFDESLVGFIGTLEQEFRNNFPVINHFIVEHQVKYMPDGPEVAFDIVSKDAVPGK